MRDVFFEEVECEDPEAFILSRLKAGDIQIRREEGAGGALTFHVVADGLVQKFIFTPF